MPQNGHKCLICEIRPAKNGQPYCKICTDKVTADLRGRQAQQAEKYLVYRGAVVGLFRNGNDCLTPRLLKRNPEKLPKCKTLDLHTYLQGYTREQVKKMKRTVIKLTTVKVKN